jgi:hypothetical protein
MLHIRDAMDYGHEGNHVSAPQLVTPAVRVHDKTSTANKVPETARLAHAELEGVPAPSSIEQHLRAMGDCRRSMNRKREYKLREPEKIHGRDAFDRKENDDQRELTMKTAASASHRC